jgi:hypothetical protein
MRSLPALPGGKKSLTKARWLYPISRLRILGQAKKAFRTDYNPLPDFGLLDFRGRPTLEAFDGADRQKFFYL